MCYLVLMKSSDKLLNYFQQGPVEIQWNKEKVGQLLCVITFDNFNKKYELNKLWREL